MKPERYKSVACLSPAAEAKKGDRIFTAPWLVKGLGLLLASSTSVLAGGVTGAGQNNFQQATPPALSGTCVHVLDTFPIEMAKNGKLNQPQTIDDLIEFVVGRCLDQVGIENKLTRRWGQ